MKVKGLDGKLYSLKLNEAQTDDSYRSSGHLQARSLITKIFPYDTFFEEITLPGTNGLEVDFLLLLRKVIFEIQGRQHFEYVPYFHKSPEDFQKSKQRDAAKVKWAELNGFYLVELNTKKTSEWEDRIRCFYDYGTKGTN